MVNIYKRKQRWKLLLLLLAGCIAAFSLLYTNRLVKRLSEEEKKKVELWSEATRRIALEATDFSFELQVITTNTTIPVILTDSDKVTIKSFVNLDSGKSTKKEYVQRRLEDMKLRHEPIESTYEINPQTHETATNYVFYDDSTILIQLRYYPYFQLAVVSLFLLVSYLAFNTSRKAEQNRVWVGMAKETAHQLGTPISSLIGWVEYMRMKGVEESITTEIEKDINRLTMVTERFSKIGGTPDLQTYNIKEVLMHAIDYIQSRSPQTVTYNIKNNASFDIRCNINRSLFEWVVENLCKNAIDAMNGKGSINISISENNSNVIIDIADTGKGMPKTLFKTVFNPGYTTKSRGWGLGLSLAKRIIAEYHDGQIFVKDSELNKGTTFRIILKKKI